MKKEVENDLVFEELFKNEDVKAMFNTVLKRYRKFIKFSQEDISTLKNDAYLIVYKKWNPELSKLTTFAYNTISFLIRTLIVKYNKNSKKFKDRKIINIDSIKNTIQSKTDSVARFINSVSPLDDDLKLILIDKFVNNMNFDEMAETRNIKKNQLMKTYRLALDEYKKLCIIE